MLIDKKLLDTVTLSNRPHLAVLTADGFQDMDVIVPKSTFDLRLSFYINICLFL